MIWHSKLLTQFSTITHGSTSKSFDVHRFGSGVDDEKVIENRKKLLETIGANPEKSFILDQVHGNEVLIANEGQKGNALLKNEDLPNADAFITNQPGMVLIIKSADCVPLFFYDPKNHAIGVAHAGWKGTSKNIVQEVINAMKNEYNSDPSHLIMAVGPSICGQCYDISTVTDDRTERFKSSFEERIY